MNGNGKRARNPAMVAMGKRLKQAALAAGFRTAEEFAESWGGVSKQKVYRWWNGDHSRLPAEEVKRYAELVRADEVWLWTGKRSDGKEDMPEESEMARIVSARAADLLLDLLERVARGDDAGAAWDTVSPAPEELSPREHRLLSMETPQIREGLAALVGMAPEQMAVLSDEDLRMALQHALDYRTR